MSDRPTPVLAVWGSRASSITLSEETTYGFTVAVQLGRLVFEVWISRRDK